jgi:glycosyltransferase involved in cell wall biosynthesis
MNCYNSDTYLKEAIESVLSQTHQNFEIIFWDNQSTDKSAQIVKSYEDGRIKYFYAPTHTTLGEGRNRALEHVSGEFISFLDCDDWWEANKIEETLKYFSKNTIGIVHTNGNQFFQQSNKYKKFHSSKQPTGSIFEELIANYNIALMSAMFRKQVLETLSYCFDNRFSMIEEFDFFVRISKNWEINYCEKELCFWRAHSASLTWTKKEKVQEEYEQFLKCILKENPELKDHNCVRRVEAKIAYHKFFNEWNRTKIARRDFLLPYLLVDKRLILIYILSFLSFKNFNKILKLVGKSV